MTHLPSLLPIAFTVSAYIVCVKLAARLFCQTQLSWKHAAVFGVTLFLVLFAVGAGVRALNLVSDPVLASLLDLATGLLAQLALGGWYLGPRAWTSARTPVEFTGGALLALITYALVFSFSLAAAVLLPLLGRIAGIRA
jgi:hypothetical protein